MRGARKQALWKGALAGLVLGGYCFALALAASPSWHESLHHDAGSSDHACGITLLAGEHNFGSGPVPILVPVVLHATALADGVLPSRPEAFRFFSLLEHAPPLRSLA